MQTALRNLRLFSFLSIACWALPMSAAQEITVYKSPTCGCCQGWVDYLEDNGFEVLTHNLDDMSEIKNRFGVSDEVKSCHTGIINGYVVEGHVPAEDIKRLMTEKPDIVGISAPGMPMMSPGMASLVPKGYDVVQFDKNNNTEIYSEY